MTKLFAAFLLFVLGFAAGRFFQVSAADANNGGFTLQTCVSQFDKGGQKLARPGVPVCEQGAERRPEGENVAGRTAASETCTLNSTL